MSLSPIDGRNPAFEAEGLPLTAGTSVRRANYLGAEAVLTDDGHTRVLRTLGKMGEVYTLVDTSRTSPAHTDEVADRLIDQLEDC